MKSVLLSVRPEWCEKIARGKKVIATTKNKGSLRFEVYDENA